MTELGSIVARVLHLETPAYSAFVSPVGNYNGAGIVKTVLFESNTIHNWNGRTILGLKSEFPLQGFGGRSIAARLVQPTELRFDNLGLLLSCIGTQNSGNDPSDTTRK